MTTDNNQTNVRPIQDGDVGIVLDREGNYFVFNCHAEFDPENLTEVQTKQGSELHALLVALRYPQIMEVLKQMANDPALVEQAA